MPARATPARSSRARSRAASELPSALRPSESSGSRYHRAVSLPPWLRRPPRWLAIALLVLSIEPVYATMAGGGSLREWPTWTRFYDLQAQGFRAGHLHLARDPDPRVLAEKDRLNFALRSLWLWDASLYNDRYYSYWGPLPALVLAVSGAFLGVGSGLGDEVPTFALLSLQLVAGALWIERVARRVFREVPLRRVLGAIVLFAFASPTPWMLARPAVYEGAIAGGAAFLLLGLVFAFDAVSAEPGSSESRRALLLAGAAWALGLACRVTIGPPAALLAAWTALLLPLRAGRRVSPWAERVRAMAWMAAPLAASALLLLLYNELRFDSWLEFGTHYQLSTARVHMSWSYVLPNLYSYLLRPVWVTCRFPFVMAMRIPDPSWFWAGFAPPEGYGTNERVAGMLFVAPWILLAVPGLALAAGSALAAARASGGLASLEPRERGFLFCAVALPLALANGVPMLGQFVAIMRYLGDVAGALTLFGIFAAWALRERLAQATCVRRALAVLVGVLAAVTIAAGILLGLQGPIDSFARLHPDTFVRLARSLSICPPDADPGP